jgi:hypothetical protein
MAQGFGNSNHETAFVFISFSFIVITTGEVEFDLALLMSQRRELTQKAATVIYKLGFDGVYYHSRHGADLFNWALFEPFALSDLSDEELDAADPNFQEALRRLDLRFDGRL